MNRIKKISVYNVGFGDCCLCENEEAMMLVDCGTNNKNNKILGKAVSDINSIFNSKIDKPFYLLLTHLHKDHYSGLANIIGKFDEIYLPNYITTTNLMIMGAALLCTEPTDRINQYVREILNIPNILKNVASNTIVQLVLAGKIIKNKLCNMEVLLPLNNTVSKGIGRNNKLNKLASSYDIEILKDFALSYQRAVNYNDINQTMKIIDSIDIDNMLDRIISADSKLGTKSEEIKKAFRGIDNAMSIAFHEILDEENNENVLFLGDATKNDVEYLCDNEKVHKYYEFIKVQHHGTAKYFTDKLPSSNFYAFSNGGGRSGWEIDCRYDDTYSAKGFFICTNSSNCLKNKHNCICNAQAKVGTYCDKTNPMQNPVNIKI